MASAYGFFYPTHPKKFIFFGVMLYWYRRRGNPKDEPKHRAKPPKIFTSGSAMCYNENVERDGNEPTDNPPKFSR
jgi:hypothetical protein